VKSNRRDVRSIAVSVLFHAIVVLALIAMPKPYIKRPPDENSIDLEIVPADFPKEQSEYPPPRVAAPLQNPQPAAPTPLSTGQEEASAEGPAMQKPTKMLSAGVLADPRSRSAREALPTLEKSVRLEQICGLEAMAQIAAWGQPYQPDRLIAYAMANTRTEGDMLIADGAAFRSKRKWYNLAFKCSIFSNSEKVFSFEFKVGTPIPQNEWSSHDLAPIY
jgi:hypothetical protein